MGGTGARDRLSGFASVRRLTLAAVRPLAQRQLDFSPRRGRWSIGEIVDHLLLVEDLYRREVTQLLTLARAGQPAYRRHSFAEVNVAPLHVPDAILSRLDAPFTWMGRFIPDSVRRAMTELPILPTRHPDFAAPRPGRPGPELKAELASSIEKTRSLIEGNADLDLDALVSDHPLTGRMNTSQILTFLARHERRHQGQMEGVRVGPGFPVA